MHTDLSPHLHSEECNRIISGMRQCFAESSILAKLVGGCDREYTAMRACLKGERLERQAEHFRASQVRKAKHQAKVDALNEERKTKSLEEIFRERSAQQ